MLPGNISLNSATTDQLRTHHTMQEEQVQTTLVSLTPQILSELIHEFSDLFPYSGKQISITNLSFKTNHH